MRDRSRSLRSGDLPRSWRASAATGGRLDTCRTFARLYSTDCCRACSLRPCADLARRLAISSRSCSLRASLSAATNLRFCFFAPARQPRLPLTFSLGAAAGTSGTVAAAVGRAAEDDAASDHAVWKDAIDSPSESEAMAARACSTSSCCSSSSSRASIAASSPDEISAMPGSLSSPAS